MGWGGYRDAVQVQAHAFVRPARAGPGFAGSCARPDARTPHARRTRTGPLATERTRVLAPDCRAVQPRPLARGGPASRRPCGRVGVAPASCRGSTRRAAQAARAGGRGSDRPPRRSARALHCAHGDRVERTRHLPGGM